MSRFVIVEEHTHTIGKILTFIIIFLTIVVGIFDVDISSFPFRAYRLFLKVTGGIYCLVSEGGDSSNNYAKLTLCLSKNEEYDETIKIEQDLFILNNKKRKEKHDRIVEKIRLNKIENNKARYLNDINKYKKNGFVDLRKLLGKYKNIKYKKQNRQYLINVNAIKRVEFINLMKHINNTIYGGIYITETTLGAHAKGVHSHYNGYKIDIRSNDLTYLEIMNIMRKFKRYNICSTFEYENTAESKEVANKLANKESYNIRRAMYVEHIDVNLAKDGNCRNIL